MHSQNSLSLRQLIRGHLLMAALFLGGFYLLFVGGNSTGVSISSYRAKVESEKPDLLLIGNSLLRAAVDSQEFSNLSHLKTLTATSNGSSSLWWYLYVKNVATQTRHKPRYVGIMFRDSFLTEPAYRVTGSYQKAIRPLMSGKEPLVQKLSFSGQILDAINSPIQWVPREARNWLNLKIEKRTEDLVKVKRGTGRPAIKAVFSPEKMRRTTYNEFQLAYEDVDSPVSYNFHLRAKQSYLPQIIKLLKEQGITPIFIRAKRRRDLKEPGEPKEVREYIAQMKDYLEDHGALLLDFTQEKQITESHFGPGDHLSKTNGRELFMQLLSEKLQTKTAQLPPVIK